MRDTAHKVMDAFFQLKTHRFEVLKCGSLLVNNLAVSFFLLRVKPQKHRVHFQ